MGGVRSIWAPLALAVVVSCCCLVCPSQAQTISSSGTVFYLAMGPNLNSPAFDLVFAAQDTSNVTITLPDGTANAVTVAGGTARTVRLPTGIIVESATPTPVQQVVKVVSDKPITVYGNNIGGATSDSYLALPFSTWGSSYLAVGIEATLAPPNYLLLVTGATAANISITTVATSSLGPPGTYTQSLPAQRAFLVTTTTIDITGTQLSGSGPFGVIAGSACTNAPQGCFACDTVFEWLTPLTAWGKSFLTTAFYQNSPFTTPTCAANSSLNRAGDFIKLVAAQNGTSFTLNGSPLVTLDAGQAYTFLLDAGTSAVITASGPAEVLQVMTSSSHRGDLGDPATALLPPINQWLNPYYFTLDGSVFTDGGWVNLMYVGTNPTGVLLDGVSVNSSQWAPAIGLANAWTAVVRLNVTPGNPVTYSLRHANPSEKVGILLYGYGSFISFASAGGFAVLDLTKPVAQCANRVVPVGASCAPVAADVNDGSFDPNGDTVTLVRAPPGPYSLGNTTVTLTVTNTASRSSNCSAVVTVQDTTQPALTCPAPITVPATSATGATVSYTLPTGTDNCGTPTVTCIPASGSTFGEGTSLVTCTARDASANTASCGFNVTVTPLPALPVAKCSDKVVPAGVQCTAPADVDDGSFDPKGGRLTKEQAPPGPYALGKTNVVLTVKDSNGATSSCSAFVTVQDTTPPAAQCPAGITQTTTTDTTSVTYTATATDNCDANPSITCTPASGAAFPLGTTRVSCTARDAADKTGSCAFDVTVQQAAPVPKGMTVKVKQVFMLTLPFPQLRGTARCRRSSSKSTYKADYNYAPKSNIKAAVAKLEYSPSPSGIKCTPARLTLDPRTCSVRVKCVARAVGEFTVYAALVGTSDTSKTKALIVISGHGYYYRYP